MFLLRYLDLLALIGLFVQAFVAWSFVVLLSIASREFGGAAYRSFFRSFTALASALTLLGVWFFFARDRSPARLGLVDGEVQPAVVFGAYSALKVLFVRFLVLGVYQLVRREEPRWLSAWVWPVVVGAALSPVVLHDIDSLLLLQAPIIIGCAWLALRALPRSVAQATGFRLLRLGVIGLVISWALHAAAIVLNPFLSTRIWLSLNSCVDLGVQLAIGLGVIITLLQDSLRRTMLAEQEQDRLRRAMDRDERLRALGTVVSGVAHELNNPLTVIIGHADRMLLDSPDDRSVQLINEQAERCRGIVAGLSALARPATVPHQNVELAELVQRVVRAMPEEHRSACHLEVEVDRGLYCRGDMTGLEQVLTNLIQNGCHACGQGGTVRVRTRQGLNHIELEVEDDGPGISAEYRDRIFEPFFTTKAPGAGTGLGLAIAHSIVQAHLGTIVVETPPSGIGTCFRVFLPEALVDCAIEPDPGEQCVENLVLLVVDDDPGVRSVLREQAERRGWSVVEAGSAEEAIPRVADAHAVLCDLRMPGLGGVGFHDVLAEENPKALDRVLFATGDLASQQSVEFANRCGSKLVSKPFDYGQLFASLRKVGWR